MHWREHVRLRIPQGLVVTATPDVEAVHEADDLFVGLGDRHGDDRRLAERSAPGLLPRSERLPDPVDGRCAGLLPVPLDELRLRPEIIRPQQRSKLIGTQDRAVGALGSAPVEHIGVDGGRGALFECCRVHAACVSWPSDFSVDWSRIKATPARSRPDVISLVSSCPECLAIPLARPMIRDVNTRTGQ